MLPPRGDKMRSPLASVRGLTGAVLVFSMFLNAAEAGSLGGRSAGNRNPYLVLAFGLGESVLIGDRMSARPTLDEYQKQRQQFLDEEKSRQLGADIELNDREVLANEVIMAAKNIELQNGYQNPFNFTPSRHIFEVLEEIRSSKLFNLLRKMPKGAVLHAHDMSVCSTDYVISLTYREHLWQCQDQSTKKINFLFSKKQPEATKGCDWVLVSKERSKRGRKKYDNDIRKLFTLYTENPIVAYKDINDVWAHFLGIFETFTPIVTYYPVWKDYFRQNLLEFYEDGVQYLELRGILPTLYGLDGNQYTQADTVQAYIDVLNQFKAENPGFIGAKFIYAPARGVSNIVFEGYMKNILDLQKQFPDFVIGFDLVSQEDTGRPLIDFAGQLLSLPDSVNFYFHAGETNWNGRTDENLVDAVLLGTKRIGHGYAIIKHPTVLEAIKEKGIAIEVNPISNQVLKLNDDNRNHPCSMLFSDNYPVVISSDDPSFWETGPLTYDFYVAFLGIASSHSDLRTLKQLVINSLAYSSLNSAEKEIAFRKWQPKWDDYIEWLIDTHRHKNY